MPPSPMARGHGVEQSHLVAKIFHHANASDRYSPPQPLPNSTTQRLLGQMLGIIFSQLRNDSDTSWCDTTVSTLRIQCLNSRARREVERVASTHTLPAPQLLCRQRWEAWCRLPACGSPTTEAANSQQSLRPPGSPSALSFCPCHQKTLPTSFQR